MCCVILLINKVNYYPLTVGEFDTVKEVLKEMSRPSLTTAEPYMAEGMLRAREQEQREQEQREQEQREQEQTEQEQREQEERDAMRTARESRASRVSRGSRASHQSGQGKSAW